MKIKKLLILFIISFFGIYAYGQDDNLIQFSGVIRNLKYEPVEHVHIINLRRGSGTISNYKGMFSFIVQPGDSILFRAIAYKNSLVVIPDTLSDSHYPRDVYLLNDTIRLAEVKIFPWKSYEEFKVAFVNLELPNDDMQRAAKNIELIKAQLNMDFEPNADLAFKNSMKQQYEKLYYAGQYPSISILNPFNWIKFFEALQDGDFKKKKDDD
jgi:hypothetical protein